jgi:hypothetical protein
MDFISGSFVVASVGAICFSFSLVFIRLRLAVCHAKYYNSIRGEFSQIRLSPLWRTLAFLDGSSSFREIAALDPVLRYLHVLSKLGSGVLALGLIGFALAIFVKEL